MYVETVPNRNSPPAILLREGWREGKRVRKRTIANPLRLAASQERYSPPTPQGRTPAQSHRRLRHHPLQAPRPCRRRARQLAQAGARPHALGSSLSGTRTSRGADCGPCHGAGVEAGHGPSSGRGHRAGLAGGDPGTGGDLRGSTVHGHGLAVGAAGGGGEAPGPKTPWRRCPGALRPHLGVSGGALLPAGPARPFPRRQARQASDRVRAVVRPRGPSGGGGSL